MYQRPKYPYSCFSWALEFNFRVLLPCRYGSSFSRANNTFHWPMLFLFNLYLKQMKFGLFVKPHGFEQRANYNKKRWIFFLDFRSSHQKYSVELKSFANFTGKHLRWSLFWIKLHFFSALQLYYKGALTQDFSCEILNKFLRTHILKNFCKQPAAALIWNVYTSFPQ